MSLRTVGLRITLAFFCFLLTRSFFHRLHFNYQKQIAECSTLGKGYLCPDAGLDPFTENLENLVQNLRWHNSGSSFEVKRSRDTVREEGQSANANKVFRFRCV